MGAAVEEVGGENAEHCDPEQYADAAILGGSGRS
jgi:hypothetical protein